MKLVLEVMNLQRITAYAAVPLSSMEHYIVFQLIVLVLWPTSLQFLVQFHHSHQPNFSPQQAAVLNEKARCMFPAQHQTADTHFAAEELDIRLSV